MIRTIKRTLDDLMRSVITMTIFCLFIENGWLNGNTVDIQYSVFWCLSFVLFLFIEVKRVLMYMRSLNND